MFVTGYVALVALPAARSNAGFAVYYTAARLLAYEPAALARVYDDAWFVAKLNQVAMPGIYDIFFYNPPTLSLILLPLAALGPNAARLAWTLLGLPLLAGALALLARGLGLPARWGLWALPAVLLYAPVTENIRAGQAYLLLLFLLCTAFWALAATGDRRLKPSVERRAAMVAGLALGLMLVLKTAGAWLWPLLLVAGRWRALAWAALVAGGLALVSLPLVGLATWRTYLALLPGAAGDPKRTVTAYQTLTSLFGHLLDYDARWNPAPLADAPWAAGVLTLAATLGALVLTARWVTLLPLSGPGSEGRGVWALGLALAMALVVTNTPFAEGYHYVLTLPSLLIAAWWAWRARAGPGALAALALAALLLGAPLPYKSAWLQAGWLALLAYPRVYGAYLLWGWLGWASARVRRGFTQLAL
jgi:hypothetical protein